MSINALEARRKGRVPFGEILQREIERPENNLACVAARLGRNESSLRGWRDKQLSPDVDWLIAHRERFSDALLLDLIVAIGGERVSVTLVDPADLPRTIRPECIRDAVMEVDRAALSVRDEVHRSLGDNVIDVDESARIFGASVTLERAKTWLYRLTHRASTRA